MEGKKQENRKNLIFFLKITFLKNDSFLEESTEDIDAK